MFINFINFIKNLFEVNEVRILPEEKVFFLLPGKHSRRELRLNFGSFGVKSHCSIGLRMHIFSVQEQQQLEVGRG
jgi:hypothetical protein